MNELRPQLPTQLHYDLCTVAEKAVRRRDLASLNALRIIGVDLHRALEESARYGFHEITRGLREMGVEVSRFAVQVALAKSAESYWALCAPDGTPVRPQEALEAAVGERQWNVVRALVERFHVKPSAKSLLSLGCSKDGERSPPAELLWLLFDSLDDSEITLPVLKVSAQRLEVPQFERLYRRSGVLDMQSLLLAAFLAGRMANVQALMSSGARLEGALVTQYFGGRPYSLGTLRHQALSAAFLETLAQRLGPHVSVEELSPALAWLISEQTRAAPVQSTRAMTERCVLAIINMVRVEDRARLLATVEALTGTGERGSLQPPKRELVARFLAELAPDTPPPVP